MGYGRRLDAELDAILRLGQRCRVDPPSPVRVRLRARLLALGVPPGLFPEAWAYPGPMRLKGPDPMEESRMEPNETQPYSPIQPKR